MKLNNGLEIPEIGLGPSIVPKQKTWDNRKLARKQREIYKYAIQNGCRLFDVSSAYGRSAELLGETLKKGQKREDLCLMVKISNAEQRTGDIRGAVSSMMQVLGTDYIDLLLLHWPQTETFVASWLQMEQLYQEGIVRGIGVSNFHQHHLEAIEKVSNTVPVVNQVEIHPLLTQKPLIEYCTERGIQVISYSPLGRMHDVLMKSKPLRALSKKYKKSPPQIILRWNIQLGLIPLPRTLSKEHYDEFMDIFNFQLTEEEIAWIDSVNENVRLRYNPDTCDFSIL